MSIEEKMIEAGFDHPCKETCSGWQQGYDLGRQSIIHVREVMPGENYESYRAETNEIIVRLYENLGVAIEALENYKGIAGHDCDKSTTKWSAADEALNKLETYVRRYHAKEMEAGSEDK